MIRYCEVPVSKNFVFDSTAFQNSANNVYVQKSTFDANHANVAKKSVYNFKSDYERMQYKLGLSAQNPCRGSS